MTDAKRQSIERMIIVHASLGAEYLAVETMTPTDRLCADFHIGRALYLRNKLKGML